MNHTATHTHNTGPAAPLGVSQYPGVRKVLEKYDITIGIEVHCQLATKTKIFCTAPNHYGDPANSNIAPTSLGLPGSLPVLNGACVDLALRMALATGCAIEPVSYFDRKNYFYPDLPKAYQITQLHHPFCRHGHVTLKSGKRIGIERIQLEEDAGKNIHVGSASLIDFNRSGVGLIEIVSQPDLSLPEEASEYLKILHNLAVHLHISDGDLEKGNFRADANVSIKPKGSKTLGQRTEIKNVNSFHYIEKAIAYEVERQFSVLEAGGTISMETRGYDSPTGTTVPQRSKESDQDYRYFPEPDLPPLVITTERIDAVRKAMPELPSAKAERYQNSYALPPYDAELIANWALGAAYFEALVAKTHPTLAPKAVSNFFMTDVLRLAKLKAEAMGCQTSDLKEVPYPLEHSAQLLELVEKGSISGRMAKEVLEESVSSGKSPGELVLSMGLAQVSDDGAIREILVKVLEDNPKQLEDYMNGREKLFGFFVGQALKAEKTLNPAKVNGVLSDLLAQEKSKKK